MSDDSQPKFAQGGLIPNSPEGDSIPIKVTRAVSYVPSEALRRYGPVFFEHLNGGGEIIEVTCELTEEQEASVARGFLGGYSIREES